MAAACVVWRSARRRSSTPRAPGRALCRPPLPPGAQEARGEGRPAPAAPGGRDEGARALAEAHELAFPRYPGTAGDRRAIDWLAARLAAAGLDVEVEPFTYDVRPAFRALRGLLGGAAAAVLAAGGLAGRAPALGLLPLAAAFLAASGLLTWAPGLERWYAAPGPTATANVAGRRRARGPRRLSLVLLAHHDSKSQNLPMLVRGALTTAAVGGSIALAACLALAAGGSQEAAGPAFGVAGATAACLLVLATLTSGNRSPGGVDNAGSVAALLALARRLPGAAPAEVELIFLSPGAEEDHMVGAMRWLAAHRAELAAAPAWALNLDGLGAPGRVALLERYGAGRWFSRELSAKARRAAAHLGLGVRGVWLPPAMGVDAIPFAHRGVPCLTLATGSLGRAILAVHSARDVAANLDPAALAAGIALAGEVAREVWEGGQARGGGPAEPGPGPPRAGSVRN